MNDLDQDAPGDALLDRLKASLQATEIPAIDAGFQQGVMTEIRAHVASRPDGRTVLTQRIFRNGAIVAAAVALLCAGISFFSGLGLGLDLTRLVALEPDALLQLVLLY